MISYPFVVLIGGYVLKTYDSSYDLRVGWKNGLKNVDDEKKYICAKSNLDATEVVSRKSMFYDVHGFIPDTWFVYPSFMPRKDMQNRSTSYRNKNEFKVSCEYVKNISVKVKVGLLAEVCEYYDTIFVQLFLLEVITRNRNVDIVFDDSFLNDIFELMISYGVLSDENDFDSLYQEFIYYATKSEICECVVDDINKVNILLFNPKQTLHPTTTYPIV